MALLLGALQHRLRRRSNPSWLALVIWTFELTLTFRLTAHLRMIYAKRVKTSSESVLRAYSHLLVSSDVKKYCFCLTRLCFFSFSTCFRLIWLVFSLIAFLTFLFSFSLGHLGRSSKSCLCAKARLLAYFRKVSFWTPRLSFCRDPWVSNQPLQSPAGRAMSCDWGLEWLLFLSPARLVAMSSVRNCLPAQKCHRLRLSAYGSLSGLCAVFCRRSHHRQDRNLLRTLGSSWRQCHDQHQRLY